MKTHFWHLFIFILPTGLFAQKTLSTSIGPYTLIVRVPTYSAKTKFLKTKINDSDIPTNKKEYFLNQLYETKYNRDQHLLLLKSGFKQYFNACDVLFIPDSLFKTFLMGNTKVFISETGEITNHDITGKQILYLIHGKDESQLLLTDKDGKELNDPWPYKKYIFFPAFQQLFDRKSYIINQIKWFDKKIKKALEILSK